MMGLKSTFKRFFELEDDMETNPDTEMQTAKQEENAEPKNYRPRTATKNVVDFKSVQHQQTRVLVIEPNTYDDVQEIADHLKNRKAVVVNFGRLDPVDSRRMIDFLGGAVYIIDGHIQKLGADTFICAPEHVDISGVISEVTESHF